MITWSADDHRFMGLALQLAIRGEFFARPNPMVGCVIVKDGAIVGQGWHQNFGGSHAEVNALTEAGPLARGATCYVTLEPCAHVGKTGACAEALKKSGVARVIAAMKDPNPSVAGKGFAIIEGAGISTAVGLLEIQARELNRGFISRFERKRPWVTVKLAMSVDGRTALADGSSQWITGSQARQDVQCLRGKQDAIITGIGTQLSDNPSLTSRIEFINEHSTSEQMFRQPLRVLLDREAKANLNGKFFQRNCTKSNVTQVWWVTQSKIALEKQAQADLPHVKLIEQQALPELLEQLAAVETNNVLVEAGHRLAGGFLQQGLVDEIVIYIAPKLMGHQALGLFELPISTMPDCTELELRDTRQFGNDIRMTYQLKKQYND